LLLSSLSKGPADQQHRGIAAITILMHSFGDKNFVFINIAHTFSGVTDVTYIRLHIELQFSRGCHRQSKNSAKINDFKNFTLSQTAMSEKGSSAYSVAPPPNQYGKCIISILSNTNYIYRTYVRNSNRLVRRLGLVIMWP